MPKQRDPRRTLVLNASYEPLTTVSWQRAVILILADEAEVLEPGSMLCRSASIELLVPSVLRLREYRPVPYKARSPLTRRGVLARDRFACCYCSRRKASTVDHVQPRSRKGRHVWENVVAACSPCNAFKDDHTPEEALLLGDPRRRVEIGFGPMRFQPKLPEGNTALIVAVGGVLDPVWEHYLVA